MATKKKTRTKTTRKTRAKRTAARGKAIRKAAGANPKMDWLLGYMKKHPRAVYADAAAAGKKAGHQLHPIVWGRAQVMLGRVKAKPRGTAKKTTSPGTKRGPGRPRKAQGRVRRNGRMSIPVADADLRSMQELVDALNSGGHASLRYDGNGWELTVE